MLLYHAIKSILVSLRTWTGLKKSVEFFAVGQNRVERSGNYIPHRLFCTHHPLRYTLFIDLEVQLKWWTAGFENGRLKQQPKNH